MAKRSNNWERQNKDSFRENRNKTRYMSKKSAKGLRDLVFICRSINRAVYTGKKRKALSGLNNWVVTMFFFILIKWLLFFQSLRTSSYERFNLHFISSPGLDHVSRTISVHMAQKTAVDWDPKQRAELTCQQVQRPVILIPYQAVWWMLLWPGWKSISAFSMQQ